MNNYPMLSGSNYFLRTIQSNICLVTVKKIFKKGGKNMKSFHLNILKRIMYLLGPEGIGSAMRCQSYGVST